MLWPCVLKTFSEQLDLLKVDDDGINPMEHFPGTTIDINPKNTTHGDVQFMSQMKDCKAI